MQKVLIVIIIALVLAIITIGVLASKSSDNDLQSRSDNFERELKAAQESRYKHSLDYSRGAREALTRIMLLDLELKLKHDRKNWGEMAVIVCERMGIEPDSTWTK